MALHCGWRACTRLVALLMGPATTCFLVRATALEMHNMHKPGPSRRKWMALHHRQSGHLMINVHARSGDMLQAEHGSHEMLQARIQPDETYSTNQHLCPFP